MGKFKKNKPKREKKPLVHRTKTERQEEVKNIISTLSELHFVGNALLLFYRPTIPYYAQ